MIDDEQKLLDYMSKFYNIPASELQEKYSLSQLQDAYNEIEQKTKYQKFLDDKKSFPSKYLMKEFSPL